MKKILIIISILIFIGVAYYLISPLFRTVYLDEALPTNTTEKEFEESQEISEEENYQNETSLETNPINLIGTKGHPVEGTARIVSIKGENYVRYENFKTINGPDLFVYLSKDLEATDFINLGELKATEGNVNYEIPDDINPRDYPFVLVWCRAFSTLFNSAELY